MSRPRLGFLGVGWIGRDRMRAIAASGAAQVSLVADVDGAAAMSAAEEFGAQVVTPEELLWHERVDGVVIATPSAMHAEQAIAALDRGLAVFCQKPLGRSATEVEKVVAAARRSRRPLDVDLSYRSLRATQRMREVVRDGQIGEVYATDLMFHNAYGPDKAWFLDRELSGGGCVIDLATHLVDLASWLLPDQQLQVATSRLYTGGVRLGPGSPLVEDYATATLDTSTGGTATLACSWFLHAGRPAMIRATLYGTEGAVSLENVDGSFYDFEAALHRGTEREVIASPPDQWGGRAAVAWAERVGRHLDDRDGAVDDRDRDDELDQLVATATLIDAIYAT